MPEIIAHVVQQTDWTQITLSVCSIIISIAAVVTSVITYLSQKKHNKNSVRPILNIVIGDYEDDLYVRIVNNGVGPANVTDINCTLNARTEKSLIKLIPYEASVSNSNSEEIANLHQFTHFVEDITGRTIPPNGTITLLQLRDADYAQKVALRTYLKEVVVGIKYTDVYNGKPWDCKRELSFFGRDIQDQKTKVNYFI